MESKKDLRSYLTYLVEEKDLRIVDTPVSPEYEIQAYVRKSADTGGPAFLFTSVKGYPGQTVAAGIFSTRKRVKRGMEFCHGKSLTDIDVIQLYIHAMKYPETEFDIVGNASCQDKFVSDVDVDLRKLPICTSSTGDRGPFITGGIQVVKSPISGTHGLGIHRMNIIDKNHLSCMATKERRVGHFVAQQHEKGKAAELAVIIGAGPADVYGSMGRIPHDNEKYGIVGALLGRKPTLVRCRTIDVLVPACAEMIIECEVPYPVQYHKDVPFLEFTDCSNQKGEAFICKVKAITFRDNPIYLHMSTGKSSLDDHSLCELGISSMLYERARSGCSEVLDLCMDDVGNSIFFAHVKIKRRMYGEVINLIYQLLSDINIKGVYVYDEDIDIRESKDRMWAFETRMRPDRDVIITEKMVGASLDPSCDEKYFRHTSKIGFDCTRPWGHTEKEREYIRKKHERGSVPGSDDIVPFWLGK